MAEFDWNQFPVAQANNTEDFNWEQFEDVSPKENLSVVDEAHPDIGWLQRTVAKNLAQSPEKQAEYLKLQYPGLDVRVINGEVVARGSAAESFKKLDPSSLEFSDITDLGDVVTGGLASAGGTIAGAAGVGAVTGGAGAIPGAMAGAAAAGSAHEALRQKLGQWAGIPQDVDGGDVALAGGLNAAGVGLLGTGVLPQAAKAGQTQGLIRAAWNKGMPQFAQFWTGVPTEVLKKYVDPASRETVDGLVQGGKTQFTDEFVTRIRTALNNEKNAVGSALRTEIDGAGGKINIGGARRDYQKYLGQLKDEYLQFPNAVNKAKVDAAQAEFDALWKNQRVNETVFKQVQEGGKLKSFKPSTEDVLGFQSADGIPLRGRSAKALKGVPEAYQAPGSADQSLFDRLGRAAEGIAPENPGSPGEWTNLPLKGFEEVRSSVQTTTKPMSRLEANPGMSQYVPDEVDPSTAFRIQQDLKEYGDMKRIGSGLNPRYASQATQSEIDLSNLALSGYQQVGRGLDEATAGASPVLKAQYGELKDLQNTLAPSLRTDQSAYNTFTNMDGKSKVMFREALEKLGKKAGEDFTEPATMLQAADYFGKNSWAPQSIAGSTSTTRSLPAVMGGMILGAKLGMPFGPGGIAAGGVAGGAAGGASASPNALKAVIRNTDWARAGADQLGRFYQPAVAPIRETIIQSPWSQMGQ